MAGKPKPCIECGTRPKALPRQRCITCYLRHQPIGEQVDEARRRFAMVPPELRRKRTKSIQALAPEGTAWCAGCQSFRDLVDFGKGATQCRACASAAQHSSRIEKVYGLAAYEYDAILKLQGGRCAICRGKPKSKRLAVDHDHGSGAVRGLLCSRCNHDLMGSAWDSLGMATALWHYLNTPPASGKWTPTEQQPRLAPVEAAGAPPAASEDDLGIVAHRGGGRPRAGVQGAGEEHVCTKLHYMPVGWSSVEGKSGVYFVEDRPEVDAPF